MATQSPFSFLDNCCERVLAGAPQPPQWLVQGMQHRLVLFLNHVLMQEPQAAERLARQCGRVVRVQWRVFHMALRITAAGLLDVDAHDAYTSQARQVDLHMEVTETSALALARGALSAASGEGGRPAIRIEGDVQLASDIQWVVDHVRWDVEEDLARVMGDAPAHAIASVATCCARALRRFAAGSTRATSTARTPV